MLLSAIFNQFSQRNKEESLNWINNLTTHTVKICKTSSPVTVGSSNRHQGSIRFPTTSQQKIIISGRIVDDEVKLNIHSRKNKIY